MSTGAGSTAGAVRVGAAVQVGRSAPSDPVRVGVIGYGLVGRRLTEMLEEDARFALAFVHARSAAVLDRIAPDLRADTLDADTFDTADMVVEAAHPVITQRYGVEILRSADYLPMSTSALVEDPLRAELLDTARNHGTRLLLPHGALVGLESLIAGRQMWREVTITFVKNPAHIEPADGQPLPLDQESVLYDGPVRGIAGRFPRNVNSMVTLALATTGLDACRGRLLARPGVQRAVLEIEAVGVDGSRISVHKEQPMAGVSGSEMVDSLWGSVLLAAGARAADGLTFI